MRSCSSRARRGSARRRSCARSATGRRHPGPGRRLRRAAHAAAARAAPRHPAATHEVVDAASARARRALGAAPARADGRRARGPALGRRGRRSTSLRLLARRIETLPRARGRHLSRRRARRARIRCGSLLGELPRTARRASCSAPLSADAVASARRAAAMSTPAAARAHRRQPVLRHRGRSRQARTRSRTAFATPCWRARRGSAPGARALLDAVAIVPTARGAVAARGARGGRARRASSECLASGMLRAERDAVALPARDRARRDRGDAAAATAAVALHRRALAPSLAARPARTSPGSPTTPRRPATPRPSLPLRAGGGRARRDARRAPRGGGAVRPRAALRRRPAVGERAALLERRAYECYLTDEIDGGDRGAPRGARRAPSARGDRLREGDAHRWLSRLAWFARRQREAVEAEAPARDRAARAAAAGPRAGDGLQQHVAAAHARRRPAGARDWGERAIALAERARARPRSSSTRSTTSARRSSMPTGPARARSSSAASRSRSPPASRSTSRAPTPTSASSGVERARLRARRSLICEAGIEYCRERDLDAWLLYMLGWQARSELDQGRWDAAASAARGRARPPATSPAPSRITPLDRPRPAARAARRSRARGSRSTRPCALARGDGRAPARSRPSPLRARRGALARRAGRSSWPRRPTPRSRSPLASGEPVAAPASCAAGGARRRARTSPEAMAEPYRLELAGASRRRGLGVDALGCPYDAALALARRAATRTRCATALDELQRLGASRRPPRASPAPCASAASATCATGPRAPPARTRPASPRASWRCSSSSPRGCATRDIAERLVLVAEQTVDHHVSAILRKLGVRTRDRGRRRRRNGRLGRARKIGTPADVAAPRERQPVSVSWDR